MSGDAARHGVDRPPRTPEALLSIRQVVKQFAARPVLCGISLEVAAGEFLTILGESGSGKTTLLRLIAGFEQQILATKFAGVDTVITGLQQIGAGVLAAPLSYFGQCWHGEAWDDGRTRFLGRLIQARFVDDPAQVRVRQLPKTVVGPKQLGVLR